MADYFTHFSCIFDFGSAENAARAEELRGELAAELDRHDGAALGFDMKVDHEHGPGALWLSSDGFGEPEHVIRFVLACAEAFDLKDQWGFVWALTCSKPRLDGFGGVAQLLDLGARATLAWTDCDGSAPCWIPRSTRTPAWRSADPFPQHHRPARPRAGLRRFRRPVMGWLYMQSLGGHSGPRQYLDAQFTYERPDHRCRVLRSALVGMRTYYAALEIVRSGHEREVTALVCLVRYNPRDREGYVFGYKDMDEGMGPCEADCPEAILDLLTPTDRPYAVAWRERCRANAARRRELAAKPSPRPGQSIVFDEPLRFSDGCVLDRFVVAANPRSHRSVHFRDPTSGGLYRIPGVKRRGYRLLDPPAA